MGVVIIIRTQMYGHSYGVTVKIAEGAPAPIQSTLELGGTCDCMKVNVQVFLSRIRVTGSQELTWMTH